MLIVRRRCLKLKNILILLNIKVSSKSLMNNINYNIVSLKQTNIPIMLFFLLQHISSNYKSPNSLITHIEKPSVYNLLTNYIQLRIPYFIQNKILNYFMFHMPYRYYPFKENLITKSNNTLLINFIKLPTNIKLKKLETISTGETINFSIKILNYFNYIEYLYILNSYGFTNVLHTCDDSSFVYDYILIVKEKFVSDMLNIEI